MHQVIELHFDDATEQQLFELIEKLRSAGLDESKAIPGVRPHITLASSEGRQLDSIQSQLTNLFSRFHPIAVQLSTVGLFPKSNGNLVMYLGPAANLSLCGWHSELFRLLDSEGTKCFDFTRPELAVFHSTLSHDLPKTKLRDAVDIAISRLPILGRVTRVVVVEYLPAREKIAFELDGDA
ncbi:MAG: 2'-5' RNA ligase family protein [Bdellovibrionota bacterium]|nr:MAG: 2'-5' RNA ligase family protein [Bdellovibrionota bacterium]